MINSKEKLELIINNYVSEFENSNEYIQWKLNDKRLYEDESLRPYFKKKKEMEDEIAFISKDDPNYQNKLKEYFDYVESLSKLPSIKKYLDSYNEIKEIKNIIEDELLIKIK